jgi:anti-sigma B factor antagonist
MNVDQPFSVTLEQGEGGTARLVVVGEVDLQTAPVLRQRLAEAGGTGGGDVVVDLEGVGFLDSTGLNALLGARAALQRDGRQLRVERASTRVVRVFEVAGVADLFADPVGGADGDVAGAGEAADAG